MEESQYPKQKSITIFYSYAEEDRLLCERLDKHLSVLKHLGYIDTWFCHEVTTDEKKPNSSDSYLDSAQIILLLLSAHYVASEYHYNVELKRALQRQKRGEAYVIPILLRPIFLANSPLTNLRMLPSNGKAVTHWSQMDLAFLDIVRGISEVVVRELSRFPVGPTTSGWWSDWGRYTRDEEGVDYHPQQSGVFTYSWTLPKDFRECYWDVLVLLRDGRFEYYYLDEDFGETSESSTFISEQQHGIVKVVSMQTQADLLKEAIRFCIENKKDYSSFLNTFKPLKLYDKVFSLSSIMNSLYGKGQLLYFLRRLSAACKTYEQALQLDPLCSGGVSS